MKTAIYIAEGVVQLVLTAESAFEKSVLGMLEEGKRDIGIYRGAFYGCQGGWVRWKKDNFSPFSNGGQDDSLIFRLDRATPDLPGASD